MRGWEEQEATERKSLDCNEYYLQPQMRPSGNFSFYFSNTYGVRDSTSFCFWLKIKYISGWKMLKVLIFVLFH